MVISKFPVWVAAVFVCLIFPSRAAEVEATLDRDSVAAGNGALLSVKVSGGTASRPVIPAVENLIVNPRGQNQQIQMFNGSTTVSTTFQYAVGSMTPGNYRIPAIEVEIDGEKKSTQPLDLKVLEADASPSPPTAQQGGPSAPPKEEEPVAEEKRFGFLTVELADSAREHVYVGEIAPVRIRAWLPPGARAQLRSGIQPEARGFTLHNVSEGGEQSREVRDGKTHTVVTWFGGISATKAGTLPASLSLDLTVAVPDTSAPKPQRGARGGPFDDPFFDSMFDRTPMIEKEVTLKSEDQEIEVRPLPTEGKPEGFSGAVGEFEFDATEIPDEWKTGEPQEIGVRLKGSGNFALMKAPQPVPADVWKTYPGKDEFRAVDQTSFSGNKTFRFSAVPRKGGEQEAVLAFSFFDPAAEIYRTITSPPKAIRVAGADLIEVEEAKAPETKEPEKKKEAGLVGQRTTRSPAASLVPLVSRPAFREMLGISGGMILLGGVLAVLRVRREDPRRRARALFEKANRETLAAVGAADGAAAFFPAARLALQQRLGAAWNQPPQAITTAEVEARLAPDSPVARFFREADLHAYSPAGGGEILPEWRALLDEALASLNPSQHR
jgi:BatD DUF11 like domain